MLQGAKVTRAAPEAAGAAGGASGLRPAEAQAMQDLQAAKRSQERAARALALNTARCGEASARLAAVQADQDVQAARAALRKAITIAESAQASLATAVGAREDAAAGAPGSAARHATYFTSNHPCGYSCTPSNLWYFQSPPCIFVFATSGFVRPVRLSAVLPVTGMPLVAIWLWCKHATMYVSGYSYSWERWSTAEGPLVQSHRGSRLSEVL